ncbi:MAG: hypothetical protein RSG48_03665 [Clostridia bacterium]
MAVTQDVAEKLYSRSDIINFMGLTSEAVDFKRMTGFTDNGKSLNPSTYERKYVDEKTTRKDVTGYAAEIAYTFDRYTNNEVHNLVANVHDLEQNGVMVPIVAVNLNEKGTAAGAFKARKRLYSVLPDGDGDGTDAYQYSGTFGSNGDLIEGEATTTDKWKTCKFTANTVV